MFLSPLELELDIHIERILNASFISERQWTIDLTEKSLNGIKDGLLVIKRLQFTP